MKKISTRIIALCGVMAALVFASNFFSFPIFLTADVTRIHLGNVCVLLSGFLLGGFYGGLAAGIGAGLYDLANPLFVNDAIFTFTFRFVMAFICGKIAYARGKNAMNLKQDITAGVIASIAYIIMHLSKTFIFSYYIIGNAFETSIATIIQKSFASTINAIIGVSVSVPLAIVLKKNLPMIFTDSGKR